ncbi:tetratricopeptide repeat protein [Puia sp. P3]|uniref:tetratricopeptide repeat protein n=1 Tax=Puia sp. P3 TaxID=3423952 RepID=UPI003D663DEF
MKILGLPYPQILLAVAFLIPSFAGQAQYNPDKVNKKAVQLYSKGLEQAQNDDLKGGIETLKKAPAIDNNYEEACLSIAGMYSEMKDHRSAVQYYEKAKAIDSDFFKDYNLPYSIDLAGTGNFEKALQAIDVFLTVDNLNETSRKAGAYRERCYQFALDYSAAHQSSANYKFEPHNLGDSINTEVSEYYPSISLDGSTLIFTRRVNHNNEDFYQSTRTGNSWSKAHSLEGDINTNYNEAAQTVSLDGQMLIFNGCDIPGGRGELRPLYLLPDNRRLEHAREHGRQRQLGILGRRTLPFPGQKGPLFFQQPTWRIRRHGPLRLPPPPQRAVERRREPRPGDQHRR